LTCAIPPVAISIGDIIEAIGNVNTARDKVVSEPMEIPGVGQYISFLDTEGNRGSMIQRIPRN
jgi:predicted enzyme related to lactoylglutathione lyase